MNKTKMQKILPPVSHRTLSQVAVMVGGEGAVHLPPPLRSADAHGMRS